MHRHPLVILGAGYTARFILPLAAQRYAAVYATSREPDRHLTTLTGVQPVRFDLAEPETWRNVPIEGDLLWCFPAVPPESVQRCAAALRVSSRRLVVLGSTSAYDVGQSSECPPPWTDETSPIDRRQPRVEGEEFLRNECGAILLRVAGIYGPGRNPLDWIRTGRVRPSHTYVNLIHVEDVAAVCLAALERGIAGEAYNVSDGTPRTWDEICGYARTRWHVSINDVEHRRGAGKRIATQKLSTGLGRLIRHDDLMEALETLEGRTGPTASTR